MEQPISTSSSPSKPFSFWRWLRTLGLVLLVLTLLSSLYLFVVPRLGQATINVGGIERSYLIHLPANYDPAEHVPLVIVFHQYTANGWAMEQLSDMNEVADENGFIVVYPNGYQSSWNEGSGQFAAEQAGVDDVAFTAALIDELSQKYSIDPNRVYAAGFSHGGFMAQRLACELSGRISAIGVVSASMTEKIFATCRPDLPVSVMMIHGTADLDVPWKGGNGYVAITDALGRWVGLDYCSGIPIQLDKPDTADDGTNVSVGIYSNCLMGRRVALYTIKNGNHSWPGGNKLMQFYFPGKESYDIDASTIIWEFLRSSLLKMPQEN